MIFCDACPAGKNKHLPFHLSCRLSTYVLELVHCDIWGPSPIVTTSGYLTLFLLMIIADIVGFIL